MVYHLVPELIQHFLNAQQELHTLQYTFPFQFSVICVNVYVCVCLGGLYVLRCHLKYIYGSWTKIV